MPINTNMMEAPEGTLHLNDNINPPMQPDGCQYSHGIFYKHHIYSRYTGEVPVERHRYYAVQIEKKKQKDRNRHTKEHDKIASCYHQDIAEQIH